MSIPHSFDPMGTAGALPPLPAPYTRVRCLVSNCHQALDTGIAPDVTTRWEIDYCYVDALIGNSQRQGTARNNGAYRFELSPYAGTTKDEGTFFSGWNTGTGLLSSTVSSYVRKINVLSSSGFSVGGQTFSSSLPNVEFGSIGIFCRNSYYGTGVLPSNRRWDCACSVMVFGSKIYKNEILLQDLVPALDATGTPCFYDLVTGKAFYAFANATWPFEQLKYEKL